MLCACNHIILQECALRERRLQSPKQVNKDSELKYIEGEESGSELNYFTIEAQTTHIFISTAN